MSTNYTKLRVGVVGAGNMGRNHLRVYSNLKQTDLVGVYDINKEVAADLAKQYNCQSFDSLEEMQKQVDAVSICSPSSLHAEQGLFFLENKIHCLIEKPLATSEEDCLALINMAKKSNVTLCVGHIERFNPAVQLVSDLFKDGQHKIHAIDANRMSMVSSRITDVDVVADLMVHDLDIVLSLMGEMPKQVIANGVTVNQNDKPDHVNGLLTFANGTAANITASRITPNKIRELNITSDFGYVTVDYINQDVYIYRQNSGATKGFSDVYTLDVTQERALTRRIEPLVAELQNFVHAVMGQEKVKVTGEDGLAALKVVNQVQQAVRKSS